MKWFTSDLHHKHKRIVEFTDRGRYTNVDDHTDWIRNIWNSTVAKGDIVYHLGDFSFASKKEEVFEFAKSLNGNIIMIKGNHDRTETLDYLKDNNAISAWYDYKEIKLGGDISTVLFHFPISSWHKQVYGAIHLHGHTHGNLKEEFSQGKILDVGLDNAYNRSGIHKFFSEEEIVRIMENRTARVNDHHKDYTNEKQY